jgi:hypothetical protein
MAKIKKNNLSRYKAAIREFPGFLLEIIPYPHEDQAKIEHDGKWPRKTKIDRIKSFQILNGNHRKSDHKESDAELCFCCLIHTITHFSPEYRILQEKSFVVLKKAEA